ncbi:MAG: DNA damage-inducible protein D [Lachnospiraceae bacterium]|nr:DNA damage-inducible protein D [Lachnospiraceae bacterium]
MDFNDRLKEISDRVQHTSLSDEQIEYSETIFENIKHINEYGQEFWYARELQKALEYTEYNKFVPAINRAIKACEQSGNDISIHFAQASEMLQIGNGAKRNFPSYKLSRYACYLIVMNGDSRKQVIALGQTYFAVKTRQQELIENYNQLSEDRKRLAIRHEMKEHNKSLVEAAQGAGVIEPKDFAIFQNKGYQGLYGGLGQKDIHSRKGLKKSQNILDHMGSTELAANLFRATQTDEKLRNDNVQTKSEANKVHYEVGKAVRQTIKELGGTMPEDLPTPEKSIKQIEREEAKRLKQINTIE